jgi:hypothetical protein
VFGIDIEHREKISFFVRHRNYYFRSRPRITRNVPGKFLDIRYDDRSPLRRRRSADASAERNL